MNELQIIEYGNQRVLLTEQLAQAYGCETVQIRQNYINNQVRFKEGKHYFKLEGETLRDFKASLGESKISTNLKFAPSIMLWTERGASRHSKMLGTDMAWEVFDQLEETYFSVRPKMKQLSPIELIAAQANALVEQEKKLQAIQARQEQQSQELQGMRDVIQLSSVSWRKETTNLLNKIAKSRGEDNYMEVRRESYNVINERMGVPIVFFEGDKNLNGFHSMGISFINRKAGMSPSWTFWHEAFHWMSRKNPALFESLVNWLKAKAPFSKEQLNAYRASIGEPNMSDEKVIEEMMADAMPEIRKRMGLMKELATENKSLYQRFVAWIREAMDTLRDFFHSNPTGLSTEQVDLMHEKFADLVRDIHGLHNEAIIKVANTPNRTFTLPSGETLINYSRIGE